MTRRSLRSLIQIYAFLVFVAVTKIQSRDDQEACDKMKCPGPLAYYKHIGCTPVYEAKGDCCATKYNCDHLKNRSKDKCYVNGKKYEIGESLRDEDANPCDIDCKCTRGFDRIASFKCAIIDCISERSKPGCYRKKSPTECCPGDEVCPLNPEDMPVCEVDGKVYKGGEQFNIESDPDLICVCQSGYKGKNVEPFCAKPFKRPYCTPDFHNANYVFNNCAPVYYSDQSPQVSCSVSSRCQNSDDIIINNDNTWKFIDNSDDVCYFGNMTMHRGDELNQSTDYSSVCVKCVCEVPPVPTCQHSPDSECDITEHLPFRH